MTDQGGDRDVQPSQQTDTTEKRVVSEGSLLTESNDDLADKRHEQPAAELCTQACKNESLMAASEVCVIKQKDSKVQHELGVPSLQSTANEIIGNVLPCVTPVPPVAQGTLNAVQSSELSTSQECEITSATPALVTGDQEMEVSVSAQLETLSFETAQLKYQETEHTQDQHSGQENNFPQVDITLQDSAANAEISDDDESSSSDSLSIVSKAKVLHACMDECDSKISKKHDTFSEQISSHDWDCIHNTNEMHCRNSQKCSSSPMPTTVLRNPDSRYMGTPATASSLHAAHGSDFEVRISNLNARSKVWRFLPN